GGRGEGPGVRREGGAEERGLVPLEAPQFLAGGHLPREDGAVITPAGGQEGAVGREGQAGDEPRMRPERPEDFPAGQIPEGDGGVIPQREGLPVGGEGEGRGTGGLPRERSDFLARGEVPEADPRPAAGGGVCGG